MKDSALPLNKLAPRLIFICSLLACLLLPFSSRATVISGNIVGAADSSQTTITDGTNSAVFYWSENIPGSTAWVYSWFNTAVAVAPGITNVTQITNAGAYTFTTSSLQAVGPIGDAAYNGGIGGFVILKGPTSHYAVVRIDDVQNNDTINATWWLQEDGTGNFSSFVDTNALGRALAVALDATNLTWSTGGASNWLVESNITEDGVSAAQSGHIGNNQTTWIKAVVPTNGTVSFFWKTSSQQFADLLSFYINGVDEDDLSGEFDWNQETYPVSAGDVLMWKYAKDASVSAGSDAGWVDQVQFVPDAPIGPITATFDLVLTRTDNTLFSENHTFGVIAEITSISPVPTTQDYLQSSDGLNYGIVDAGSSTWSTSGTTGYATLADMIFAITNQPWSLAINQGAPNEEDYTFRISISGVTTNNLGAVVSLAPVINATNVATNTPFQWSGPAGFTSTFVNTYRFPTFFSYGQLTQGGSATNWPSPPALNYGTNGVTILYTSNNVPGITTTTPLDSGSNPIFSWTSTADLEIDTEGSFIVGQPAPLPVQLGGSGSQPPAVSSNAFKFGFQTLAGRNHIIQSSTNLMNTNAWTYVTNFIGDGAAFQLNIAISNNPGKYFRVISQ